MSNQDVNSKATQSIAEDEIDLKELFNALWRGKWIILLSSFVAAVVAVLYTLNLPNIYKSEALLAPTEESGGNGLSALAGQFGGLASLAGINLSGASGDKVTIALELLKSRQFIGEFIQNNDLKPAIMAAEGWNPSSNSLLYDESIYQIDTNKWVRDTKPPKKAEPSAQEVHKEFVKENLVVTQDKETGLVTLSIKHFSPFVAKDIASKLVEAINTKMRQNDISDAQRSIDYLNEALLKTNVADMQQVFYQLIEKQQQTKMLANVRDEYVLRIIDPPIVAEEKSGPKRAIICVLFVLLGAFFGVLVVLVKNFIRK
tara:strand:+ start:760 stop:1704 length:945 start_codon:yes stop_codon:yes gene_type:complete